MHRHAARARRLRRRASDAPSDYGGEHPHVGARAMERAEHHHASPRRRCGRRHRAPGRDRRGRPARGGGVPLPAPR